MASAYIVTRRLPDGGRRYICRFRLGGRESKPRYGGSFKTRREAEARARWINGELAARRVPDLRSLEDVASLRQTVAQVAERYQASRVDYSDNARMNLGSHLKRILPAFGARDPSSITWTEIQDWVAAQSDIAASSLVRYMGTLRLLLDYAEVDPNPARDRRVKLPRVERPEPQPPTRAQFQAMLAEVVPERWRLPLRVLEACGLRVGELADLRWADVDVLEGRFRVSRTRTKTRAGQRWVQVPAALMVEIESTCPLEDRTPERAVFPGASNNALGNTMARACKLAGIPHYSPHDLRHRRLSLWHAQGVPARELAERAGHSRASMSLDVYSHVLVDRDDEWC